MSRSPRNAWVSKPEQRSPVGAAGRLLLVVALGAAMAATVAADDVPVPRPLRTARVATFGLYVFNIRDLDVKAQRFGADFYCWMRYHGEENMELERIEFPNGHVEAIEVQERKQMGTQRYVSWKVAATFQARFSLRNYPFDSQRLEIMVEHPMLEADVLEYTHDEASYHRSPSPQGRWGIKNALTVPEFKVLGTELLVEPYTYETDFGEVESTDQVGSDYSRLILAIKVQRLFWPYVFKILVPFAILLLVAYLSFWLPPHEILSAVLLAAIALLSSVAFQSTVSENLPQTGYLVLSDKFFIATLFLIMSTLAQSVVTYNLARSGRDEAAYRLDVASRVAFPILCASLFAFLIWSAMTAS